MLSEQLLIAHKDILDKNICSEKEIEDIIGFIESFKGIYLYPRVLRRKFNIDMAKAYEILNELVRIGVLRLAFEIYCSDCDKFQNAVYDSLNEIPKKGADNKLVAFLHPKGTNGVLVELCQEIK